MKDDTVSRQAAIDAIGKKSDEIYKTKQKGATYPHDDFFQGMAYAENVVKQLPSVQPQSEIVRCKDCKWFGEIGCAVQIVDESDKPSENDFCSFAERRTDE